MTAIVHQALALVRAFVSCKHSFALEDSRAWCGYCGAQLVGEPRRWKQSHVGLVASEIAAELHPPDEGELEAVRVDLEGPLQ